MRLRHGQMPPLYFVIRDPADSAKVIMAETRKALLPFVADGRVVYATYKRGAVRRVFKQDGKFQDRRPE